MTAPTEIYEYQDNGSGAEQGIVAGVVFSTARATITLTPATLHGARLGGIYILRKKGKYLPLERSVPISWRSAAYHITGGLRSFLPWAYPQVEYYATVPMDAQCFLTQVSNVVMTGVDTLGSAYKHECIVTKFLYEEKLFWEVFHVRVNLAGSINKNAFTKRYYELDIKQIPFHPKLKHLLK
ncbi:MAG: hypothetical protein WC761_02145 [Candidatus Paceibacterota bacterium]|jgi:hypothetical protein